MDYIKKIKTSISFKNFKKGFDETLIYGPLCIIFALILISLFIINLITLESLMLSLIVLAYIFFFYFPFHKSKIILAAYIIVISPLFILGLLSLLNGKVSFLKIETLSITWWIYCVITFIFIMLSSIRRNLNESDDWFSLSNKIGGKWLVLLFIIAAPFAFLAIAGTYRLFEQAHILPWIIIFVFWGISNIRLLIYKIIKKSRSHTA